MAQFTVIGLYADNNQPWMRHAAAVSPREAARIAVRETYDRGRNGVELEDIFVVEVIRGRRLGTLCNDRTLSAADLSHRAPKSAV